MQSSPVMNGQISGNVLMYSRPEPLSLEMHGKLGLNRSDKPFGFARAAGAVPLQVTEFGPASLSYPIIFAGEGHAPMAVMGIRPDENLFVAPDGGYDIETYVPAFIRRYPFVLANNEADQQLIVCIDRASASLSERGDVPLFENGEPSAFTQNAIQFCTDFETERTRTEQFVASLKELDLFESKQATFTPRMPDGSNGQPVQLADYFAISEERLGKLSPDQLTHLNTTGALRQIYSHLNSLFNWERLVTRTAARGAGLANG